MQNSFHNTGLTSFACELQFSMVLSWVDDVSDGSDANTRGVSEHLLNRDRQTVTEADAEQTAMQRTQSRIAVEGGTETTLA